MKNGHDPLQLPVGLPLPVDDGACDHLVGMLLPNIALTATDGREVLLANLKDVVVIYCYPRTGRPGITPPHGWDLVPGARGCTPQSCAFRDHYTELKSSGVNEVFGLSTQDTLYQKEVVERLHLPFPLLSDMKLILTRFLKLPTFYIDGMELIKRLTLFCIGGRIERVFYPVFPPNENPTEILQWWEKNKNIYKKGDA